MGGKSKNGLLAENAIDFPEALARAHAHSPFLSGALDRQSDLEALLREGRIEEALTLAKAQEMSVDLGVSLRRERLALATALAIGDLAGALPLSRVMQELSDFADSALDRAIAHVITRRVEGAVPQGFAALALGKQGAHELNYSSDIDPILIFDPETLPRRARDEPGEAAQRYAREIVQLLSAPSAEGYVFRVDLRLRPASEVSPLAISYDAMVSHYESSALTWERAAFIRARAAGGDRALGEEFLEAIRPFVWRRSLDFGTIEEITALTRRIRSSYDGPAKVGPDFNLKQGRGGIREVEFYAQTLQLIHGGRDPALRQSGTRAALNALAHAQIIAEEDAQMMGEAYDYLREIEHRLQMVDDQQTHSLPSLSSSENVDARQMGAGSGSGIGCGSESESESAPADAADAADDLEGDNAAQSAIGGVAALSGYESAKALVSALQAQCDTVAQRYDILIDTEQNAAAFSRKGELTQRLRELGYSNPPALAKRIRNWSEGRFRALRSAPAREAFQAILPMLVEEMAQAPDPDAAILHWENMLERAPSAINLFRLLEARPGLLEQLLRILMLADPLAQDLGNRPDLLDTLIDQTAFDLPGEVAEIAAAMEREERAGDYEHVLDRIRIETSEERFSLGVQLIEAAQDPLQVAAGLSRVAEAGLGVAARAATREFAAKHGVIAGGELAIIGLGRLGGSALTHASDLDIIYVFSGSHDCVSDGEAPLGATRYFNRLAQRIGGALSVPTTQGALYEIDTRLRPQGAQGPLAVSIDSFARYQRENAWEWEHMALARARIVYSGASERGSGGGGERGGAGRGEAGRGGGSAFGGDALRNALEAVILGVLTMPRDPVKLRDAVLSMRGKMAQNKPAKGPIDVKLLRGGLVDLEFIVHYLQLKEGANLLGNASVLAEGAGAFGGAGGSDGVDDFVSGKSLDGAAGKAQDGWASGSHFSRTGTGFDPNLRVSLQQLIAAGLLDAELLAAHDVMARLLISARLLASDLQMPASYAADMLARSCSASDAAQLMQQLAAARRSVARAWENLFDQRLEWDGA